jgi:hypothetical protein
MDHLVHQVYVYGIAKVNERVPKMRSPASH